MKILIIALLFFTASCSAQTYPLNTSIDDLPYNAYLKDINGELDQYVGLWTGTWAGKTLYIEMKKVKYHYDHPQYPFYKDRILGERKVVNANGIVEIDRITNFDYNSPEIRGPFGSFSGEKIFMFSPKNMCKKQVSLYIKSFQTIPSGMKGNNTTITKMTLHFEYEPSYYDPNCQHNAYMQQYDDLPVNFPKDIVLTKQ